MYSVNLPVESLIAGPTREPLDIDEVKKALQFASDLDDTLIDNWIATARQRFEEQTGRQIMTATWEYWLDRFPCQQIELPKAPLRSVVSLKYIDPDGVEQTLVEGTDYRVRPPAGPIGDRGWVEPIFATVWPPTRCEANAVRIQYLAGYGNTLDSVPEMVKSTLYMIVTAFFCGRCAEDNRPAPKMPIGLDELLAAFRLRDKRPLLMAY